jgi:hypothetical protein
MKFARTAAKAAVIAAMGAGACGIGAGIAHADDHNWQPPWPGPGVNVGWPGNPLPPGHDGLPPPGHRGWHGEDNDDQGDHGRIWAPPPPPWAPWAPVIWDGNSQRWGVVVGGVFIGI